METIILITFDSATNKVDSVVFNSNLPYYFHLFKDIRKYFKRNNTNIFIQEDSDCFGVTNYYIKVQ